MVSASGRTGRGYLPHYPKISLPLLPFPPTILLKKCVFCNFHAVFAHFAQNAYFVQNVLPLVEPLWKPCHDIYKM